MVIPFTPQPKHIAQSAPEEGRTRKRAIVYSFIPTKSPDGSVSYPRAGIGARRPEYPASRGHPDPWDGGDAA